MVKNLISALIGMVIGLALLPVVGDFAADLTREGVLNDPGLVPPIYIVEPGPFADTTVGALIDLLPVLYVIIVVASAVGFIVFNKSK
jgi:hypothetical protein